MAIPIKIKFFFIMIVSQYCVMAQSNFKSQFNNLLMRCTFNELPFNSRTNKPQNTFGINKNSNEVDKNLFIDVFYKGDKKKLNSTLKTYNQDEDKVTYKNIFRSHGIGWIIKKENYYLIEFGCDNDTIDQNPAGGIDFPSIEYIYAFSANGEFLDKLPMSGFYTHENDNIECFIDTNYIIVIYHYLPNNDAFNIKGNIYVQRKGVKFLTKLYVNKYTLDSNTGKFKQIESSFLLLKSSVINYRQFNSKGSKDDPMLRLPKKK